MGDELVGTEWVVTSMDGFGPDNVVEGKFDFTHNRYRIDDGTNHMSWTIEWSESGFEILESGTSTTVGYDEPHGHLAEFVDVGTRVEITINWDGSLTMVSGERTVGAKADGLVEPLGISYEIAELTGFSARASGGESLVITTDELRIGDGSTTLSWKIEFDDDGFTVVDASDAAANSDSHLAEFVEVGSYVEGSMDDDGTMTLVSGGRTVVATPSGG